MSRQSSLVIALLGLASAAAFAQEAVTLDPALAPEDTKPAAKKTPAATEGRKSAPVQIAAGDDTRVVADPAAGAGNQKARRVVFSSRQPKTSDVEVEDRPRTFWEKLFGLRKPRPAPLEAATPAPVPAATPKPTPRPRKVKPSTTTTTTGAPPSTSAPALTTTKNTPATAPKSTKTTTKPAASSEPEKMEKPTPAVAAEPPAMPAAPKSTPAPKKGSKSASTAVTAPSATPARKQPVPPPSDADAEAQEKYHYDVAKDRALQDPEVQKLKEKAEGATNEDEAKKAQRAYNKALFTKMRSLDGSIKDRADRIEAAILKRLDSPE